MFESLTEKLNTTFDKLRNKGKLTEKDVDDALREIRLALLEADVSILKLLDLLYLLLKKK